MSPIPRDYFAARAGKPDLAPARIATLRDKLTELARCGVDQVVVLPFNARLANLPAADFISDMLVRGLGCEVCAGRRRFSLWSTARGRLRLAGRRGRTLGFEVARMQSYEVHGLRVSSSAVRDALAHGQMEEVAALLGRPYSISGHVVHGRKLGRELGISTGVSAGLSHP